MRAVTHQRCCRQPGSPDLRCHARPGRRSPATPPPMSFIHVSSKIAGIAWNVAQLINRSLPERQLPTPVMKPASAAEALRRWLADVAPEPVGRPRTAPPCCGWQKVEAKTKQPHPIALRPLLNSRRKDNRQSFKSKSFFREVCVHLLFFSLG
jgi:hypothetical protein